MSSLLTDAEKAAIVADYQGAIDTFVRALKVYQEPTKTVIISDPDYNPYTSNNQNNVDITNTPIENIISGSILWSKRQDLAFINPFAADKAQIKVGDQVGPACRVKVGVDGYNLLASAKKVEIDGILMDPASEPRPHGLFGADRWSFYYQKAL